MNKWDELSRVTERTYMQDEQSTWDRVCGYLGQDVVERVKALVGDSECPKTFITKVLNTLHGVAKELIVLENQAPVQSELMTCWYGDDRCRESFSNYLRKEVKEILKEALEREDITVDQLKDWVEYHAAEVYTSRAKVLPDGTYANSLVFRRNLPYKFRQMVLQRQELVDCGVKNCTLYDSIMFAKLNPSVPEELYDTVIKGFNEQGIEYFNREDIMPVSRMLIMFLYTHNPEIVAAAYKALQSIKTLSTESVIKELGSGVFRIIKEATPVIKMITQCIPLETRLTKNTLRAAYMLVTSFTESHCLYELERNVRSISAQDSKLFWVCYNMMLSPWCKLLSMTSADVGLRTCVLEVLEEGLRMFEKLEWAEIGSDGKRKSLSLPLCNILLEYAVRHFGIYDKSSKVTVRVGGFIKGVDKEVIDVGFRHSMTDDAAYPFRKPTIMKLLEYSDDCLNDVLREDKKFLKECESKYYTPTGPGEGFIRVGYYYTMRDVFAKTYDGPAEEFQGRLIELSKRIAAMSYEEIEQSLKENPAQVFY